MLPLETQHSIIGSGSSHLAALTQHAQKISMRPSMHEAQQLRCLQPIQQTHWVRSDAAPGAAMQKWQVEQQQWGWVLRLT
jgi:hypothetical protein